LDVNQASGFVHTDTSAHMSLNPSFHVWLLVTHTSFTHTSGEFTVTCTSTKLALFGLSIGISSETE